MILLFKTLRNPSWTANWFREKDFIGLQNSRIKQQAAGGTGGALGLQSNCSQTPECGRRSLTLHPSAPPSHLGSLSCTAPFHHTTAHADLSRTSHPSAPTRRDLTPFGSSLKILGQESNWPAWVQSVPSPHQSAQAVEMGHPGTDRSLFGGELSV